MAEKSLVWTAEAEARLKKAPFFVRKLARSKIEKTARERNAQTITLELVESVKRDEMS